MPPIGRRHDALRRLRELVRDPALRKAEGVLVAEGLHLAAEALDSGAAIEAAFVAPRLAELPGGRALRHRLEMAAATLWEATDEALDAAQDARSPQPVAVVARVAARGLAEAIASSSASPLVVVAWAVQDPGNLGTLLRSADAAGSTGFVVCGEAADLHHPRAVRASMGSIFRLPAVHAPLEVVLERLAAAGIPPVAAVPGGADYAARDWTRPVALFLGREGAGLPAELVERSQATIGIPMAHGVESLSVAAAGAVVLFEAARQRRVRPAG